MKLLNVITLLLAFLIGSIALDAKADSGTISGTFRVHNKNGNFCPSGLNCTGAVYPQSLFDQPNPARNAKMGIFNFTAGFIGLGSTDDNGNFSVAWFFNGTLPNPCATVAVWYPDQKDGRFFIRFTDGTINGWGTNFFCATNGANQNVGTWTAGSSASPDQWANAYWAAEVEWREALSFVGVLQQNFTSLEIRGFANTINGFLGTCNSSCAVGPQNKIQLDANAAFSPQNRVMHEMGHIATYKAKPFSEIGSKFGAYCYPQTSGESCQWTFSTQEWATTSFSEGIATFAADSALYFPDAASPTTCLSNAACTPFSTWSLEANETSCSSGQQRFPLTTMRYLWDVYDTGNDGESVPEGPCCYWMMMGVLANYASGTSTNQADEPWNSNFTGLDARDGRATNSWEANYNSAFGRSWTAPQNLHCNPL